MAFADPIPVRFTEETDRGLAGVSASTGLSKAELIRIATDEFLARTAKEGKITKTFYIAETSGDHSPATQNFSSPAPEPPADGGSKGSYRRKKK